MLPNETYNIKASAFVRCALGPLEGALEMERGIVYQLDLDVGCLVVLAIWNVPSHSINPGGRRFRVPGGGRTGDLLIYATQASIHGSAFEADGWEKGGRGRRRIKR